MFPALASARPAGRASPFSTRAIRVGLRGKGEVFLHRSAVPLDAAELSTPEDHGRLDIFGNECFGALRRMTASGLRMRFGE